MFSPSMPHCPLQAPSTPQQLGLPFGLTPHLGHLALVTAPVAGVVAVVELDTVTGAVVVVLMVLFTGVATGIVLTTPAVQVAKHQITGK